MLRFDTRFKDEMRIFQTSLLTITSKHGNAFLQKTISKG